MTRLSFARLPGPVDRGHGGDALLGQLVLGLAPASQGVLMIRRDDLTGQLGVAESLDLGGELVVEDIGEVLVEDQWQDEVLELGRVGGAAYGTGGVL